MVDIECPICFFTYDFDERAPLKTFCCGKTLCRRCIEQTIASSSNCPWDKRRWSGRTLIHRFLTNSIIDIPISIHMLDFNNID